MEPVEEGSCYFARINGALRKKDADSPLSENR